MDTTPNLRLPYIFSAQAQKHVTHNEGLQILDALVQLGVVNRTQSAPPASPVDGARYIVAVAATGDWSGQDNSIAIYQDGAWIFHAPQVGWLAWDAAAGELLVWVGSTWMAAVAGGASGATILGVNATADATNRLAVKSDAVLFSHDDVTPGSGDQRAVINKAAVGNTASIVFQDNWSGRAEFGLAGDDDWRVKVSPDGGTWREALIAERTTGRIYLPQTPACAYDNILINGDFQLNQRVVANGVVASGVFARDRWKAGSSGASLSVSGYDVTLASGSIEQKIVPDQWGAVSFASTQFTVSVEGTSNHIYVELGSASGTIAPGAGRRSVTLVTAAGDTGNLTLKLFASSGAVTFSRVAVRAGAMPSAWLARPWEIELRLAQRFFQKSYRAEIAPGASDLYGSQACVADGSFLTGFEFAVAMHANPTFTFWAPNGTLSNMRGFATGTLVAATAAQIYKRGVRYFSASPLVDANFYECQFAADAEP
ncbi:MAG: DUF2793 domain-containing protein [Hyphomicrobiaceae bacterium]|nr:DUF2793 domain-containing protein [Hyphomicrobiaceae bacterium]